MKPWIRTAISLLSIGAGALIFVFSLPIAFGWDRGPFSFIGIIFAVMGLSLLFMAYYLVRETEAEPLVAVAIKIALWLGSSLLVLGMIALFFPEDIGMPKTYFLVVGIVCLVGSFRFRSYRYSRISGTTPELFEKHKLG